jgi:diguanylate cyclase (GGDEF)-like protein
MPGAPRTNPAAPRGAQADLAARLRQGANALRDQLHHRDTLVELIRTVNATLDPSELGDALLSQAAEWFPAECLVVAVQDGSPQPSMIARRGPCERYEDALVRVAGWIAEHNEEFVSASLATDQRVPGGPPAAVIGFPLIGRERTIGALIALDSAESTEKPSLSAELTAGLCVVLEGPSLALDTLMHLRRVEALSVTDDLTSLYNSRYLNHVLHRESKRASRSGRPLSLLFLDLDGFKSVNDRYGHLCGSRALVEAANVIRRCARETDVTARFGGDEFAVILPDTGSEGAVQVAERVRERIAAYPFLKASDGLDIRLTASVGVATLPDVAASAEELIKAADTAMYRVKDQGKNGVLLATDSLDQ